MNESYANPYVLTAAQAAAEERAGFIRRVYLHLAGALLAFAGVCTAIQVLPAGTDELGQPITLAYLITMTLLGTQWGWLLVIAAFVGVGWVANTMAHSGGSNAVQYGGLALYIAAMSVVITPMLWMAANYGGENTIPMAGILTLVLFAGLTLVAFTSGVNFSFLRGAVMIGSLVALGIIVLAILFGFTLGIFFAGAMVLFLGMTLLYQTSTVMHEYRTDQHVGASLALFSSVAMLFYYILFFFLSMNRD